MIGKVREVFTEDYRKETEYREFTTEIRPRIRLKNKSESVEDKVQRLQRENLVSDFKIKVGKY